MTTEDRFPGGAEGRERADVAGDKQNEDAVPDPAVQALEADLHETRQELAHTVDQLTARLDVKTRSREALQAKKSQLRQAAMRLRQRVVVGAGHARDRGVGHLSDGHGRSTAAAPLGAVAAGVGLIGLSGVVAVVIWRRTHR
ncbi:DUF3618 domain-containing protein [Nocardioides sp. DS6]|uniref:DUF3618 domain-containing protein n=1 Tax=Nocardioides eburneus TaxID=3231482 RepID=A0ABV3SXN8_9ACTN